MDTTTPCFSEVTTLNFGDFFPAIKWVGVDNTHVRINNILVLKNVALFDTRYEMGVVILCHRCMPKNIDGNRFSRVKTGRFKL